ncbi:hypothetical protein Goshw_023501 [Gossypium schwendimanii]|uniref:Uncharacterized protein n=1 Tax=Gossypium schwendimanii TaxID=34291 RepID=A0A7J9KU64_GOSSC|nr:hypothetical protein [Gossypium schwendimanii]
MLSLMNGYSTLPVIYKIIFLSFSTHLTSSSNSQLLSEIFPINLKDYRTFTVSRKLKPEDVVRATLSSFPDEVVDTISVTTLPSQDSVSERRKKLEYLEMQKELIKEEEEKEEEELARMKESKARKEDVALKEMNVPIVREAQEQAIAKALEKRDQLCEISCALVVLASTFVRTLFEDFCL